MQVSSVSAPTPIEPDHVYLATPGANLAVLDGVLHSMEPDPQRRLNLPIDFFFRSLAQDVGERAVGIILSGTGSDGSLGVKAIKGTDGMVMAQTPISARYPDMPASAIATEVVDYVLPVEEMPEQLLAYAAGARLVLNVEANRRPASEWMQHVFILLRDRTGHDFSGYKQSTMRRRIERRMNVHHIDDPRMYVRYLQTHPTEAELLLKELLIGVTSFFRDPEAFRALGEEILPQLIESRPEGHVLRAWVPGCSTGEEAYSLGILIRECMDRMQRYLPVQIFATDLNLSAIDIARAGVYPEGIAVDLSRKQLERFFVEEDNFYRVRKELRELLIFAPQNLLKDPPFTKLDLLVCRNLLIYLEASLQHRLLPLFHYALRPGGILFLGSSESIGSFGSLFEPLDKRWKIFRRKEVERGTYAAEFPISATPDIVGMRRASIAAPRRGAGTSANTAERVLVRELVPPSVIIHERGDIVYVHGRTGSLLEPATGTPESANIFNMARDGLQFELAAALRQASQESRTVVRHDVQVKSNGDSTCVDLYVRRLEEPESFRGLYLVCFQPAEVSSHEVEDSGELEEGGPSDRVARLERELHHTRESHQSTVEELETANEELKSTNEELQSTNEELQSTNEELETSKEEMQSLNEELHAVNTELNDKVEELSRANDDMRNLLNGTDIATIFLDNQLQIKRYTERAKKVISLIPSDIGRPIGDLVSKLYYDRLVEDVKEVLETLVFKEVEVRGPEGTWYLMRVLPYRTTENVIEGLVISFIDTTKIKHLEAKSARLRQILADSPTSVYGQDNQLRITWAYGPVFGHSVDDVLGKTDAELLDIGGAELEVIKQRVLNTGVPEREEFEATVDGRSRTFNIFVEWLSGEFAKASAEPSLACVLTELKR
jgi:two-component system CheB/CheR fusion protein